MSGALLKLRCCLPGRSFEEFYQHNAIFLEPITTLRDSFDRSPLLFWTIGLVASQTHPSHGFLYDQLYEIQNQLLSGILHSAIQSIEVVHALLLLCLWPVPNTHGHKDPSWNYVSLAISAAIQLHCHKPLPECSAVADWASFGDTRPRDLSIPTQSLTWLSCFDISTQ